MTLLRTSLIGISAAALLLAHSTSARADSPPTADPAVAVTQAAPPDPVAAEPEALHVPAPAAPAPIYAVPDATYNSLLERVVTVQTMGGQAFSGRILATQPDTISLALVPSGVVVSLRKADITQVGLTLQPQPPPIRERGFGLQFGLIPSLVLDVDAGLFYGFAVASLLWPIVSEGDWLAFAAGLGVSLQPKKSSPFKLDIFAHFSPVRLEDQWDFGFGVGFGFHYTTKSGFTLAVKIPVIGYSVRHGGDDHEKGEAAGYYYLTGVMSLPVFSLGYRF